MNPHEHALHYPPLPVPATGTVTAVRDGVYWLRMPLPFALDHINLWLLADEVDGVAGWTLIDTGVSSDATRAAWEQLFDTVFDGRPLLRLLCTHFHPDHFGLAWWLVAGGERARWHAPLLMTHGEYMLGRLLASSGGPAGGAASAAHFARHGLVDEALLAQMRARGEGHYRKLVPQVPPAFRRLHDGDELAVGPRGARRLFRVIVGRGHAPEHVSLHCADDHLLIAGDMVLPRISTNVSVFELEPEADPLALYLRALDHYLMLPAATLVLPSHGQPFTGLHARVGQQHAHHAERLAEVLAACATPQCALDIVPLLFRRQLDAHQLTFAVGEAIAHLHALWHEGRVTRRLDADGIYRFIRP